MSGEKVATPTLIRLLEAFCLHPEETLRHLDNMSLQEILTLRYRAASLELKLIRNTISSLAMARSARRKRVDGENRNLALEHSCPTALHISRHPLAAYCAS